MPKGVYPRKRIPPEERFWRHVVKTHVRAYGRAYGKAYYQRKKREKAENALLMDALL